jgi:enoyl-CoA hydratase/carnithine racemase
VVVLAGAGKHFCAGHDLREMRAHPEEGWQRELFMRCNAMMLSLVRLPQPVIARVQGAAVAAGCQLVSMCDLAVASEAARFALPGIKSGLFCTTPGVGVSRNLSRKHAMELLLTGDLVDAHTAERWGLVNRVVPAAELDAAVKELAGKITVHSRAVNALGKRLFYEQIERDIADAYEVAAHSRAVNALGKRLFYEQIERGIADAYDVAGDGMACNMTMEDAAEGIDAFLAKRPPSWRGR